MQQKRTLFKGIALGIATSLLLSLLIVPGFAATVKKTIQVYTGITLYYDGVKFEPKDALGGKVEPLLYNGTTYLPVRAMSNLFGEDINWDGNTWSVYIGDMPGQKAYLGVDLKAYQSYHYSVPATFSMDGKTYANGFTLDSSSGYALFNISGKYSLLEFDIGHVMGTAAYDKTVLIYLDGKLSKTVELKAEEMVKHVSVPLNSATQIKVCQSSEFYQPHADVGFANAKLS